MKRQFRLQLAPGKHGGYFHFEFGKGSDAIVVTEGHVKIIKKSDMLPSDRVWTINLRSDRNPYVTFFYDPRNADSETWMQIADLIRYRHDKTHYVVRRNPDGTFVYGDKKEPVTVHIFDFIDETQLSMENYVVLKNMIRVMNTVARMSTQERADVMYYYGYNPAGMTASEMFIRLCDPNEGIVTSRNVYDRLQTSKGMRTRTYVDHFIDTFIKKQDVTTFVQAIVRRAMMIAMDDTGLPLIQRKNDGGYYINDRFIAPTFEQTVVAVASDKKLFEMIRTRVEQMDVINEDDEARILAQFGYKLDKAGRILETEGDERTPEIQEMINYCIAFLNIDRDYVESLTDEAVKNLYQEGLLYERRAKDVRMKGIFNKMSYEEAKKKIEEMEALMSKSRVRKKDVDVNI